MARHPLQHAQRLADQGRHAQAEQECRQVLLASPEHPRALRLLGQVLRATGKPEESAQCFQHLLRARPHDRQLLGELGVSLVASGQPAQALGPLTDAVAAMPGMGVWRAWLGRCLLDLQKPDPAIAELRRARDLAPRDPLVLYNLADALRFTGRAREAEEVARELLAVEPRSSHGAVVYAEIIHLRGRHEEALRVLRGVLAADPHNRRALENLVTNLRDLGRYQEALAAIEPLVQGTPDPEQVLTIAPVYAGLRRHTECKALIEQQLDDDSVPDPTRSALCFHLGLSLDALGDYSGAFEAYTQANRLAIRDFTREKRGRLYRGVRDLYTPEYLRAAPRSTADGGRCVFIVGMPRSGTTLLEQVLDSHPGVYGAGELDEITGIVGRLARETGRPAPECLRDLSRAQLDQAAREYLDRIGALAPDPGTLVIDKLPHNFFWLGFITQVLPGARVLHIERHPLDACVSCYATGLSVQHGYSNDLADVGWEYGQYRRLMQHWRDTCRLPLLDVRYEDLVADLEGQARRVVRHPGLPWDGACLRFHESERAVATASVNQVRQPLYTKSIGRWKRYAAHLGPLLEELARAGIEPAEN